MNGSNRIGTAVACAAVLAAGHNVKAQWVEETHELRAGWNTVYLEIDPSPPEADSLFDEAVVREVWARAEQLTVEGPPDCADPNDPDCVPDVESDWDVWVPPSDPSRVVTNLRIIRGGQVYLIRATSPTTLTLKGTPSRSVTRWHHGFNLQGMHVEDDPASAPTFAQYFAGSDAFANLTVYELLAGGAHNPIADPANTKITPGAGYWVESSADTEYDGPIRIDNSTLRGIDFARQAVEHSLRFENLTPAARSIEMTYVPSSSVPGDPTDLSANAGDLPLSWLEYTSGPVETALQRHSLTTATWGLDPNGNPSARQTVRIGFERAGLSGATVDSPVAPSQYQGLLQVRDGTGYRRWLSVVGQVPSTLARSSTGRPGLYYGQVTVDQVQWVTAGARTWTNNDPNDPSFATDGRCVGGDQDGQPCEDDQKCPGGACEGYCVGGGNNDAVCIAAVHCPDGRCSLDADVASLRPAPAPFTFPVIVHLAANGTYSLLKEVSLLWQQPDEGTQTPGRFVLATPACDPVVCDALEAASIQDGEPFARRLGSAAFSFDGDLPLTGDFDLALEGEYTIPEDHPLNPFRHKFHPDHDCDQEGECFELSRSFTFSFAATPPEGESRPGWGDQILGGTYEETLTGLHRQPISVGGRFELSRISGVSALNAQ